jgi:hypothetical protein
VYAHVCVRQAEQPPIRASLVLEVGGVYFNTALV